MNEIAKQILHRETDTIYRRLRRLVDSLRGSQGDGPPPVEWLHDRRWWRLNWPRQLIRLDYDRLGVHRLDPVRQLVEDLDPGNPYQPLPD